MPFRNHVSDDGSMQEMRTSDNGSQIHSVLSVKKRWTFLTNHGHVLLAIAEDANLRLREIAAQVGITERAAQLIIADLIQDGYLTRTKVGRRNRYTIDPSAPLRHPMMGGQPVSSLIEIFKKEVSLVT